MNARDVDSRRARSIFRDLLNAVEEELGACDPQEIRQHPTLRRHQRVADRARRFLNEPVRSMVLTWGAGAFEVFGRTDRECRAKLVRQIRREIRGQESFFKSPEELVTFAQRYVRDADGIWKKVSE